MATERKRVFFSFQQEINFKQKEVWRTKVRKTSKIDGITSESGVYL